MVQTGRKKAEVLQHVEAGEHFKFWITSPGHIKIVGVKNGEEATSHVVIDDPVKLRTSPKAKYLREFVEAQVGKKYAELEDLTITKMQKALKKVKKNQRRKKEPEKREIPEEIKQKATELLEDPLLLHKISEDMEKWIVGEKDTRLLKFLLDVSCKSKKDYAFQIITADSAAGKTWLTNHVLAYLPKEWWKKVGRLTRTSLDYLGDQKFDLLWIQERRGGKEAADSIRLSSVEDGGTKIWVTERNEEGRFETHEYTVPGRSIVTTTVNTNIDTQDLTRSWMLSVDESEEQTEKIHDYEAEDAKEPLEFKKAIGNVNEDFRPIVHEALRQLDWNYIVMLPFASELKNFVDKKVLRSRRDFKKLIRLIRVVTLLHQKQRPTFEIDDTKFLVCYPQDAYMALEIGAETFQRTAMGLDEREKAVMDALKEGIIEIKGEGEQAHEEIRRSLTRREVAQKCKKSMTWAYNILQGLVDKGYADVDESGKAHKFNLRTDSFNQSTTVTDRLNCSELEKKVTAFLSRPYVTVTPSWEDTYPFEYRNPLTGEVYIPPATVTVTQGETEQGELPVDEKTIEHPSVTDDDRLGLRKTENRRV